MGLKKAGRVLDYARKRKELTITELAERYNMSRQSLGHVFTGKTRGKKILDQLVNDLEVDYEVYRKALTGPDTEEESSSITLVYLNLDHPDDVLEIKGQYNLPMVRNAEFDLFGLIWDQKEQIQNVKDGDIIVMKEQQKTYLPSDRLYFLTSRVKGPLLRYLRMEENDRAVMYSDLPEIKNDIIKIDDIESIYRVIQLINIKNVS